MKFNCANDADDFPLEHVDPLISPVTARRSPRQEPSISGLDLPIGSFGYPLLFTCVGEH